MISVLDLRRIVRWWRTVLAVHSCFRFQVRYYLDKTYSDSLRRILNYFHPKSDVANLKVNQYD
jgi:hypothetical protein